MKIYFKEIIVTFILGLWLDICRTQTVNVCDNVLGQAFRPDFEDCSKYHLCSPKKDWTLFCAPGMAWNQERAICVIKGSINDTCSMISLQQYKHKVHVEKLELTFPSSNQQLTPPLTSPEISAAMDRWSAKFFCPPGAVGRHTHPTKCAQYYDCSKTNSVQWWGENLRECPYPKVFNEFTKDCDSPSTVDCNTRQKPLDPCDYLKNQCRSSHCLPCHLRHATCRGLPNGLHQWRGREMTSYFIVCLNERVIFHGRCQGSKPGQYMVFSTQLQSCVDRERAQMARQSNVKALQSLQLTNLPVIHMETKSNSTINSIAMNVTRTATNSNWTNEMQQTQITLKQNKTQEYHQLNQTQFTNQTSPIPEYNQTNTAHQPSPSMLNPEPILQRPRPFQQHPVQNYTLEGPVYPEVTNQNLRIPPSAILIMTNKQDNSSVNNKDMTPRFAGINVISPQQFGFRTVQTPILVEATQSTNVNIGSNTHVMPNREVLQNTYNITQPLNTRSSIVRVVPNGWASFNSRSLIEIPSVLNPTTNKPIVEIQPNYSHMGRRIDILPLPNIKIVRPITPIMASHNVNYIQKKIQHVEQSIPYTGPFITQRQNHQAPFVQANQPVTDVPYFQPVTTVELIVNIPEVKNIKPIHPAMMSRSQIRFPDQQTELSPNSNSNSISKKHASAISKNGLHVTSNKASGKGTNYLSAEQNKTQLVSLLLDVLDIYKQKGQNSSVIANTNGVNSEKKNTTTNGNNGKQVKEAKVASPSVNVKYLKPTEVLSMDVIPNTNVLSNKHIDNIERVVTKMENSIGHSNSNNIMNVQNKQTAIVKSPARVVFLTPFKFSSKQKSHGGTVNTSGHTLSQSFQTQGNQETYALNADPLRNTETNKLFQAINFKTTQSNFPNSISGVKASDAIKHNEVLPTRSSKLVNNHQYSDLIERLNFLGTSGRGRLSEASRLLPLATLKTANFVQRRKVLAQHKSNVPTSFTFPGINP